MPERIQLSRAKGWRMPDNTIKVDRTTVYGNPWHVGIFKGFTAAEAVERFTGWIAGKPGYQNSQSPPDLSPLRGKNLACWCKPGTPCHADVLLELANV